MHNILFVCVENACRSQMAEGFANLYGKGNVKAFSAGSKPGMTVNEYAVKVMAEENIDISGSRPKGFNDLPVKNIYYVVTMGCNDVCPIFPSKETVKWDIPDPKGKSIEEFRSIKNEIKEKVKILIDHIDGRTSN